MEAKDIWLGIFSAISFAGAIPFGYIYLYSQQFVKTAFLPTVAIVIIIGTLFTACFAMAMARSS